MKFADPRLVVFKFFYNNDTHTMTMNDFNFIQVEDGLLRLSIDIEDIKQLNISEFDKIMIVMSGGFRHELINGNLNMARVMQIYTLLNDKITKMTVYLSETTEYSIGDVIIDEIDEAMNISDWKSK